MDVVTKEINEAENLVHLLHHVATDVVCTGIGKPRKPLIILSLFTFCYASYKYRRLKGQFGPRIGHVMFFHNRGQLGLPIGSVEFFHRNGRLVRYFFPSKVVSWDPALDA